MRTRLLLRSVLLLLAPLLTALPTRSQDTYGVPVESVGDLLRAHDALCSASDATLDATRDALRECGLTTAFDSAVEAKRLIGQLRLQPTRRNQLTLMNLAVLDKLAGLMLRAPSRELADRWQKALENHAPLLDTALGLPQEAQTPRRLRQRMATVRRYHRAMLHGFDPQNGPGKDRVTKYLQSMGLAGLPFQVARIYRERLGRDVYWQADVSLSLGLGGKALTLPHIPLARHDGILLLDVTYDVERILDGFARKQPLLVQVGGLSARITDFDVRATGTRARAIATVPFGGADHRIALPELTLSFVDDKLQWRFDPSATFDDLELLGDTVTDAFLVDAVGKSQKYGLRLVERRPTDRLRTRKDRDASYGKAMLATAKRANEDLIAWLRTTRAAPPVAANSRTVLGLFDAEVRDAQGAAKFAVRLGPFAVLADGEVRPTGSCAIRELVSNRDRLLRALADNFPMLPGIAGSLAAANDAFAVRGIKLDRGVITAELTWTSKALSEPVVASMMFDVDRDPREVVTGALRRALAGRTIYLANMLRLELGQDLAKRKDWPATLIVGGTPLGVELAVARDGTTVRLTKATRARIRAMLGEKPDLRGQAFEFGDAKVKVDQDRQGRIALPVALQIGGKQHDTQITLDNAGLHVPDLGDIAAAIATAQLTDGRFGPLVVDRIVRLPSGSWSADLSLRLGEQTIARTHGTILTGGKLTTIGEVTIDEGAQSRLRNALGRRGAGWRIDVERLTIDASLRPLANVSLYVDGLPALRLRGQRLQLDHVALDRSALLAAARQRWHGCKLALGPMRAKVSIDEGDDATLRCQLHCVLDPSLGVELTAGVGSDGVRFARPQLTGDWNRLLPKITERDLPAGIAAQVRELRAVGDSLKTLAVEFDLLATIAGRKATIRGNRLDRRGLHLGALPDAGDVAARWVAGQIVTMGPLTLEVLEASADTAKARVRLLGEEVGTGTVAFDGERWSAKLDPAKGLRRVASRLLPDGFHGFSDDLTVDNATITKDGMTGEVLARPPYPAGLPMLRIGAVTVTRDGAHFAPDTDLARTAWAIVARQMLGATIDSAELPFAATVTEANPHARGVRCRARLSIEPLGTFDVSFGVGADGIELDERSVLVDIGNAVRAKVQDMLPKSVIRLAPWSMRGDRIAMPIEVRLEGAPPLALEIQIDRRGKLTGIDEKALLAMAANTLASHFEGKELDIGDDIKLRVTSATVGPDLAVRLAGEADMFGIISLEIRGLRFASGKFDVSDLEVRPKDLGPILDAVGLLGDDAPISRVDVLYEGGKISGASVTANLTLHGIFKAKITAQVTADGVKLDLPIRLEVQDGFQVPIPPAFALKKPHVTIDRDSLSIGCTFTLAPPGAEYLVAVEGTCRVPFKPPFVLRADGDLRVLKVLELGHSEATLDLDNKHFRCATTFEIPSVLEMQTTFGAGLDPKDVHVYANGDVAIFGAKMLEGQLRIDSKALDIRARLALLGVRANAIVHADWNDVLATRAKANVGFFIKVFDEEIQVVGAWVKACLAEGASLGVVILNQDITLLAIDFRGITKGRLLDLILNQPICLTGFKLLASEGGGGSPTVVTKSGVLVKRGEDGTMHAVAEFDDEIVYATKRTLPGGGAETVREFPARNLRAVTRVDVNGKAVTTRKPLVENQPTGPLAPYDPFAPGAKARAGSEPGRQPPAAAGQR